MGFKESAGKFQIVLLVNEMCAMRQFNDITVGEICAQAGISRATFYRLFPDKFSLNNWCQALNFSVGVRNIGRAYTWADGLYMAYSCARFFSGVARATFGGSDAQAGASFSRRAIRACLADPGERAARALHGAPGISGGLHSLLAVSFGSELLDVGDARA